MHALRDPELVEEVDNHLIAASLGKYCCRCQASDSLLPHLQTSQVSARNVEVSGETVNTFPNVEAIVEDFRIIGKDVVKSVEARTEKWSF